MVTVFSQSTNHPNDMALTICNCFELMRDWKLENLASRKEIYCAIYCGLCISQSADKAGRGSKLLQGKEGAVIERIKSY